MSREHLYKAKRVNWRELPKEEWWVDGALFEGKENSYIFTNVKVTDKRENSEIGADAIGYLVDPETVCEYTGLTDKNGRKIFVGDIVKIRLDHYEVWWNCDSSSITLSSENKSRGLYLSHNETIEVTGNVFDNSELLEGGDEE